MALVREKTQAPAIATYTPPIVRLANSTIKQPITAQPPEVPKVAAPRLYGTPQQKEATLSKINAAQIKKPVSQQVIYVKPEVIAKSRTPVAANIFQPVSVPDASPPIIAPIIERINNPAQASTVEKLQVITPLEKPVLKVSPAESVKATETVPSPINRVPVTEPVYEAIKQNTQAQTQDTGFKFNPLWLLAIVVPVVLFMFIKKKK